MTALTVWKFNDAGGARAALDQLKSLQKQQLIEIQDAAIVEWPQGNKKPKTKQDNSLTGAGALGGAFWGMLFGALAGHFSDYGIDDDFIKSVRSEVTEGTSALFLLTGNATVDKLEAELKGKMGSLIRSNLTDEQEANLRESFGEE